jgi:hypothetical protein
MPEDTLLCKILQCDWSEVPNFPLVLSLCFFKMSVHFSENLLVLSLCTHNQNWQHYRNIQVQLINYLKIFTILNNVESVLSKRRVLP